jgi:hypothetical protein
MRWAEVASTPDAIARRLAAHGLGPLPPPSTYDAPRGKLRLPLGRERDGADFARHANVCLDARELARQLERVDRSEAATLFFRLVVPGRVVSERVEGVPGAHAHPKVLAGVVAFIGPRVIEHEIIEQQAAKCSAASRR